MYNIILLLQFGPFINMPRGSQFAILEDFLSGSASFV